MKHKKIKLKYFLSIEKTIELHFAKMNIYYLIIKLHKFTDKKNIPIHIKIEIPEYRRSRNIDL